jgi:hypothetical protein
MTAFDKKLNIWIIDDLANRRDSHEKILLEHLPQANIFKIAHPLHLKAVLKEELSELKNCFNLFFSDFNMEWSNVQWTDDLLYTQGIKEDRDLDNFPGTQKVIKEYATEIGDFMLILLSTMVVEDNYPLKSKLGLTETTDRAWEYEDLPMNTTDIKSIHKLSKPFCKDKLNRVLGHYSYLIKHLTK